jgi:hypothetical protein
MLTEPHRLMDVDGVVVIQVVTVPTFQQHYRMTNIKVMAGSDLGLASLNYATGVLTEDGQLLPTFAAI